MDTKKLEKWSEMLLDTGKRNNLINFRDTKALTVEIVLPSVGELFSKIDSVALLEVFDPKMEDTEDEGTEEILDGGIFVEKKSQYIQKYYSKIKKDSQVLAYNANVNPINAIKKIDKKACEYMEETGVRVLYMAFGFVNWKENESSKEIYRAPILLVPIELKNDSAIVPWTITMPEEDMEVNPTFNYKMEAEHGVRIPDYEEEGFDEYIEKVEAIVSKLGWSVSKECKIGIFSFLKLNMFKDLRDNKSEILKNENIRRILGETVESAGISVANGTVHEDNMLGELHNVVDADSSQIEAIRRAKRGDSFVLQGPPGTGKSQTITNMIAELLYDGKKVLFVSEKQAALNVVYDKLCKAGLGEFCLELHSHKANKKEVISDLCKTLKMPKGNLSGSIEEKIEQKIQSQKKLDQYEEELHKKREGIEKSLYQLYEDFATYRKTQEVKVTIQNIFDKGKGYYSEANEALDRYMEFVPMIGYNYKNNTWYGYANQDSSYQMREDVKKCMEDFLPLLKEYIALQKEILDRYEIECATFKQSVLWENFFGLAAESSVITPKFLEKAACSFLIGRLSELKKLAIEIRKIRDDIDVSYDKEIYKINASDYNRKLTRQFKKIFDRLFQKEYKKIISDIRLCNVNGKKPKYEEAVALTGKISEFQQKMQEFEANEAEIKDSMGLSYNGVDSDWDVILGQIGCLQELFESGAAFKKLEIFSFEEYEKGKPDFEVLAGRIAKLRSNCDQYLKQLKGWFETERFDIENCDFEFVLRKITGCIDEFDKIDHWSSFHTLLRELEKLQLLEFIDTSIENNLPVGDFANAFRRNFYRQWIDYILHLTPILSGFSNIAQDQNVERFGKADKEQFKISKAQIKTFLSAQRPSVESVPSGSPVAILLREGEKKRKQKNIRKLLDEAGELIQTIKPCFLMSPLSVSTYLTSKIRFDYVVFDEASQIFPQDAVGAIYRGEHLIVVGDSKQMPPTNFFNSMAEVDEDDEETGDITDFESILDMCSAVNAQIRLKWHYRSRYEQLIAFSNKNFYDNDLITFPAATIDKKWCGIDYYYVDGIYDRKSKNNRKEAEKIVDLIYENIEKFPNRSLGVVAFSMSQQDMIENLLSKRRQEMPLKESFFSREKAEPFFIKNLETVQGDERDTIIFSVGYAKDSAGKFLLNFGPLNRLGGERRLNVAVTRAKENVQLVASFHHTDIDLKRTGSDGVRLLKEYLDYAENGSLALERQLTVDSFDGFDSEFEMEVCEFLRENGYEVDTQVGCSGFRIDLGVKRPGTSDYFLAVECDGASYHSSKNARDRDRLRQEILESMGWKFYRIWSTEWFKNNAVAKESLLKKAREAMRQNEGTEADINEEESEQKTNYFQETEEDTPLMFPEYRQLSPEELEGLRRECHAARGYGFFKEFVKRILKVEAPLSEECFLRRIVWMFGREKVTNAVREEYEKWMMGCGQYGITRKNGFLYLNEQQIYEMRIPTGEETRREIKDVALEELAAGMRKVMEVYSPINKDGLYKYVVEKLGTQRLTAKIKERMEEAFLLLKDFAEEAEDGIVKIRR